MTNRDADAETRSAHSPWSTGGRQEIQFGFEPFGGLLPAHVADRFQLRDSVQALEALGADSLWTPGHIIRGRPVPEPLMGLARMATASERALVGTNVLPLPLYHPVVLAKQIAELDQLTGGRVVLGIGVGGEYPVEFEACQVPLKDRGRRANEAIELMQKLWSGEPASHAGPTWNVPPILIEPGPVATGGPPLVVSGQSRAALTRAAHHGQGWMPYFLSPARYAEMRATVIELGESFGRDMSGFHWMYMVFVGVVDGDGEARRRTAQLMGRARAAGNAPDRAPAYYPEPNEAFVDQFCAVGRPEYVARRLREYVAAGVEHFVIVPGDEGDVVQLAERVMREIAPVVRSDTVKPPSP